MKPLSEFTDRELMDRVTLIDIFEGQIYQTEKELLRESSKLKKEIVIEIARRTGIKMPS
jgi:hypothetical protein